jgi:long-chain acyl-CoA synthetase
MTDRHPYLHALERPGSPAQITASTGEVLTYRELDARSNQVAHLFRTLGLASGDSVALLMDNSPHFLELCWGAQRSGLYYTPISWYLTPSEVSYIAKDCEAKVLLIAGRFQEQAHALVRQLPDVIMLSVDQDIDGIERYEACAGQMPSTPIADECAGIDMLYTSGTTGRPKGVRSHLTSTRIEEAPGGYAFHERAGFHNRMVYYGAGPLYHASPIHTSMAVQAFGGTVVLADHFEAESALAIIDRYHVTHTNWVPTHFVRLLRLPEETRAKYNVSSLVQALHGAAPCPVDTKRRMIEWFGPVIVEYYGGSEAFGGTMITSEEWLAHPGSVGRSSRAPIHILDRETGEELGAGEEGVVYFETTRVTTYHNAPEKTAASRSPQGWATFGDVGWLDSDRYLYLTDRRDNLIISGGVNIYPQEAENRLLTHPQVVDAAVFGIPNDDFGEEVKAVVEVIPGAPAGPELEAGLIRFCRDALAPYKCPRSIEFIAAMPRHENGKLYKRLLREKYWSGRASRLV